MPPRSKLDRSCLADGAVELTRSFHEVLLDSLSDGVYFVDPQRRIRYWNQGSATITGYGAKEIVGQSCFDGLLQHIDISGKCLCHSGCPLAKTLLDGRSREEHLFLHHKRGHRVPVCVRVASIKSKGKIIGAMEVFSVITPENQAERRIRELEGMVFLDYLTELPNRRYIELKLKQALEESQSFGRTFGLAIIDIDHFKDVNDVYGHEAGDSALKTLAATLTASLREKDAVGRWGGEEFVLLLADSDPQMLQHVAERCRMLIENSGCPELMGQSLTVSIGATLLQEGDSTQSAVDRADRLLYTSKSRGRNRVSIG